MTKIKNFFSNILKWFHYKENWWITAGFITAISAISVPFLLMKYFEQEFLLKSFEELGVVGDFFGGTTVGLLSLTSIIFVTAAIIMQKQELSLQREEVQKTRQEYQITNVTMKKQQFESTFFNMINLHHSITKDISIEEIKGRAVMQIVLKKLREVYNGATYDQYCDALKSYILQGEKRLLDELIKNDFFRYYKMQYIINNEPKIIFNHDYDDEPDTTDIDHFFETLSNGTNKGWNDQRAVLTEKYNNEVYMKNDSYKEWLKELSFKHADGAYSCTYIEKFKDEFLNNPLKELKVETFEKVYTSYESELGHYFRNLYRIVKLIEDLTFHEDELKNNKEKQNYRGILRAQLSSYELLVIFYNIVYSKNGEKFKKMLRSTKFFDDHLSEKDFIWPNDKDELDQMEVS
ncbi:hypothetical protein LJR153_007332 [Paenibacillus sp. LjRoot153]|uniref:putative phage abortive infection protein n=1 Tax=Paenibacillus sp. LjRoot153 TaxID=3342270 RepID=UPI003ED01277